MEPPVRRIRLALLPFLLFAACSDKGPSGPGDTPDGMARISGQLTATSAAAGFASLASRRLAPADGDDFVGDETLAGITIELVDGGGNVLLTTDTDGEGEFSGLVPPGTYTLVVDLGEGDPLTFTVDLPEGASFFLRGKVDLFPNGRFVLNVEAFDDGDGDERPDSSFTIRIRGRVQGDPLSGEVEVDGGGEKVVVCHIPPGNPDNAHTIAIDGNALDAHLNHGDTDGPCSDDDVVDNEDDDLDDDGIDDDLEDDDSADDDSGAGRVLMCHVPPGNPDNPHTIEVGPDAQDAHLAHGDAAGPCEGEDGGPDPDDG